jgi:cytochrome c oxidase subunit IV
VIQPGLTETAGDTEPETMEEERELAAHPGPKQYVEVAVILALATALEVGLYYLNLPHGLLATLLLFFAVIKFSLVVLWFMHLRFDSRIFRRLFVTGLMLAMTVYLIVLTIFGALNAPWLLVIVGVFLLVAAASLVAMTRRASVRLHPEYMGQDSASPGQP